MKTIKIDLFEFNELSAEAKKNAISKNYDINTDSDWFIYELENWQLKLEEQGFCDSEIYFSGFHSQGDGASFDAKIDASKFSENQNEKRIVNLIIDGYLENLEIFKNSYSNHYSHEKTRYVDYTPSFKQNIDVILNDFSNKIEAKRLELSKDIYNSLYESYCYLQSDEAIRETLISNNYEFTKEGNIY